MANTPTPVSIGGYTDPNKAKKAIAASVPFSTGAPANTPADVMKAAGVTPTAVTAGSGGKPGAGRLMDIKNSLSELSPVVPYLAAAGQVVGALTPASFAARAQAKEDRRVRDKGEFGMSQSQQRTKLAASMRAVYGAQKARRAQAKRGGGTYGGSGQSGAKAAEQAALANQTAQLAADAQAGVDAQSQEQAVRSEKDTKAAILARSQQVKADWLNFGKNIVAGATGNPLIAALDLDGVLEELPDNAATG